MKITIEKTEEGFKYSFGVPFTYTLEEMPNKDLIEISYQILGYKLNKRFTHEFSFSFTSKEELSTADALEYAEIYAEILVVNEDFRQKSIPFVQSVLFKDIDTKLNGVS